MDSIQHVEFALWLDMYFPEGQVACNDKKSIYLIKSASTLSFQYFGFSPTVGSIVTVFRMCGMHVMVSKYFCTTSLLLINSIGAEPKSSGPANSLHSNKTSISPSASHTQ